MESDLLAGIMPVGKAWREKQGVSIYGVLGVFKILRVDFQISASR